MRLSSIAPAAASCAPEFSITENHLLAALPESEQRQLEMSLELVTLRAGQTLAGAGLAPVHVWFPLTCIVSMMCSSLNGGSAEVAVIGREGMVGFGMFIGGGSENSEAVAQCSGFAYRIRMSLLKDCFNRSAAVREVLLQYLQSLLTQSSQTALCNRHHTVEQQLCRWLLTAADRLGSGELSVTQESIANTLGVRRAGITDAAGRLQREGMIRYRRGKIELLDRTRLERHACECYSVLRREAQRLVRPAAAPTPVRRIWLQSARPLQTPAAVPVPVPGPLPLEAKPDLGLRSANDA
ncbi:MAG TPA: Crp/Fnr family transcriptional regulator [Nevskia sp.]|nr:Crp/Fnr family transcriptional regulator [Nevskia sp.]